MITFSLNVIDYPVQMEVIYMIGEKKYCQNCSGFGILVVKCNKYILD